MSVAPDVAALKRRIDDYLWRNNSMPLRHLRGLLKHQFGEFNENIAIIGGLVRDFARKGASGFKSDVDLAIDAPRQAVAGLAQTLNAKPNRFGGFSYNHPHWKVDFWALESTWAATEGHVQIEQLDDLIRCTFFDWDAILYRIKNRRIICRDDYLQTLRRAEIDINLLPTPSIYGNLLRSIRRLLLWNLSAGPRLKDFISEHLTESSLCEISVTERLVYSNPILTQFSNTSSLFRQLYSLEERSRINTSFGKQLILPGLNKNLY